MRAAVVEVGVEGPVKTRGNSDQTARQPQRRGVSFDRSHSLDLNTPTRYALSLTLERPDPCWSVRFPVSVDPRGIGWVAPFPITEIEQFLAIDDDPAYSDLAVKPQVKEAIFAGCKGLTKQQSEWLTRNGAIVSEDRLKAREGR